MRIVGLDHVQVAAPPGCEDAARAFYGDLLGLTEIEKPPELAKRGGVWFEHLHVGVEDPFTPARKAHPALRVDDLDALAAASSARSPGTKRIPGVRRFYSATPSATGWSSSSTDFSVASWPLNWRLQHRREHEPLDAADRAVRAEAHARPVARRARTSSAGGRACPRRPAARRRGRARTRRPRRRRRAPCRRARGGPRAGGCRAPAGRRPPGRRRPCWSARWAAGPGR